MKNWEISFGKKEVEYSEVLYVIKGGYSFLLFSVRGRGLD